MQFGILLIASITSSKLITISVRGDIPCPAVQLDPWPGVLPVLQVLLASCPGILECVLCCELCVAVAAVTASPPSQLCRPAATPPSAASAAGSQGQSWCPSNAGPAGRGRPPEADVRQPGGLSSVLRAENRAASGL